MGWGDKNGQRRLLSIHAFQPWHTTNLCLGFFPTSHPSPVSPWWIMNKVVGNSLKHKSRSGQKGSSGSLWDTAPFIFLMLHQTLATTAQTAGMFVPLCKWSTDLTYRIKGHSEEGNFLEKFLHKHLGTVGRATGPPVNCGYTRSLPSPSHLPVFAPSRLPACVSGKTSPKARIMPQLLFLGELQKGMMNESPIQDWLFVVK